MRIFRAPRLYDGLSDAPRSNAAVRVGDDGRILEVGSADTLAPGGDEVVDCEGTLLPGLIDCHVHLCLSGGADPRGDILEEPAERTRERAEAALEAQLAAGITTVRDLGGIEGIAIALGREVETGRRRGPRVIAAGHLLCVPGGHGAFVGREADGVDGIRAAVDEEVAAGAGCIKVAATGGMMTPGVEPGAQQMSTEMMAAAVTRAAAAGLSVAAHAQGTAGIIAALRAGVATIEHGIWLDDEALALLADTGAALVPTFNAATGILGGRGKGVPDFVVEKMAAAAADHIASFRRACQGRVRIAAGTDAGTPLNEHGSLWRELQTMVDHGLAPAGALRSATSDAAAALGRADLGALSPGRIADLVLLDGDPVEDPTAYTRVRGCWRSGR